ncbi:MAG TPA: ferritin-like domain-containing protein, partial [Polyangiaceae bacterium]|nr:ferritin-like domain-containing protein [Polyangiaceae bacterium]
EHQESDHASLAFRFVGWAIAIGGSKVREVARDAFALADRQIRDAPVPEPAESNPDDAERTLLCHGRVPVRRRAELRLRVLSEVIGPAAQALLA